MGFKIYIVPNADKAVEYAKQRKQRNYILDIRMGSSHEQEGLNALERLKRLDQDIFVVMYSAYPRRYRMAAKRLAANVFQVKSDDRESDVKSIVYNMYLYAEEVLRKNIREIQDNIIESDKNYIAYKRYVSILEWLEENKGHYVAFVNGELVAVGEDRELLLSDLQTRYSEESIFFTRVEEGEDVVEVLSPFFVDEL